MFSTILASAVFGLTTLMLVSAIYTILRPRSDAEKIAKNIQAIQRGYQVTYSFWRVLVCFLIWAATGIYLFG